jgi:hypothetical protein
MMRKVIRSGVITRMFTSRAPSDTGRDVAVAGRREGDRRVVEGVEQVDLAVELSV